MKIEYMHLAIEEAKKSGIDVPIGAIIVKDNKIIAAASNSREKAQQTANHAEMSAILQANKVLKNWRLSGCDLYVTLEPCPMCAATIVQSRITNVYFGAYDLLNGAFGSKCDMNAIMNGKTNIIGGIMEKECSLLIKEYFGRLR